MMIYVVTSVELGWDCVVGVYEINSEEELQTLKDYYTSDEGYMIHQQSVQTVLDLD